MSNNHVIYEKEYLPFIIKWGRITNWTALVLCFSPALVLAVGFGLMPPFSAIPSGFLVVTKRSGPWSPFPIFRSSAWSRHTWPSSPATSATSASPRNAREKVDGGLGRTGAALSPRWAWPFPSSSRSSSSPSTCSLPSACARHYPRFRLDAYRCFRKHRHRDLFL